MSVLLIIEHIRTLLCFRHHRAVAPSLLVTCRCCITNRKGKKEPIHVRNSAVIILQFILKIKTWQKHWERHRVEVQLQQCQQVIRSLARRKQQHCMSTSTLLMQATCQVPKSSVSMRQTQHTMNFWETDLSTVSTEICKLAPQNSKEGTKFSLFFIHLLPLFYWHSSGKII